MVRCEGSRGRLGERAPQKIAHFRGLRSSDVCTCESTVRRASPRLATNCSTRWPRCAKPVGIPAPSLCALTGRLGHTATFALPLCLVAASYAAS